MQYFLIFVKIIALEQGLPYVNPAPTLHFQSATLCKNIGTFFDMENVLILIL